MNEKLQNAILTMNKIPRELSRKWHNTWRVVEGGEWGAFDIQIN